MENSFSRHALTHCLKKITHSSENKTFSCFSWLLNSCVTSANHTAQERSQPQFLDVMRTWSRRCRDLGIPVDKLPHSWQLSHAVPGKCPDFVRKLTCAFFAVIKLMVRSSLASCPGSSPKECSLWKTPSPNTPGTLPQANHNLTFLNRMAFIRKQNLFVYFVCNLSEPYRPGTLSGAIS